RGAPGGGLRALPGGARVPAQPGGAVDAGQGFGRGVGSGSVDVLAVGAVGKPLARAQVPDVARRRDRDPFGERLRPLARVLHGPGPGRDVGDVGARAPRVAVGRDFAAAVDVVEQDVLARELVVVGRDLLAEERQVRIPIAARLAGGVLEIAEDLVVGAVLLDDAEDVLERRRIA